MSFARLFASLVSPPSLLQGTSVDTSTVAKRAWQRSVLCAAQTHLIARNAAMVASQASTPSATARRDVSRLAHPVTVLHSRSGRLKLVYPRLSKHLVSYHAALTSERARAHLPTYPQFSLDAVVQMSAEHEADGARLGFDVVASARDDEAAEAWLGSAGLTRIHLDEAAGVRTAEAGIILSDSAAGTGLVTEILHAVLCHAFAQTKDGGMGLSVVGFATGGKNVGMRGWIEKVLLLQPIRAQCLDPEQLADRIEWGKEGLEFYSMARAYWEDQGGRERLESRIDQQTTGVNALTSRAYLANRILNQ